MSSHALHFSLSNAALMFFSMRFRGEMSGGGGSNCWPVIFSYSKTYRRDNSATSSGGAGGSTCMPAQLLPPSLLWKGGRGLGTSSKTAGQIDVRCVDGNRSLTGTSDESQKGCQDQQASGDNQCGAPKNGECFMVCLFCFELRANIDSIVDMDLLATCFSKLK